MSENKEILKQLKKLQKRSNTVTDHSKPEGEQTYYEDWVKLNEVYNLISKYLDETK